MEMALGAVHSMNPMTPIRKNLSSLLSLSDEKAMVRVKEKSDHAAFALLMNRWQGPITRLCVRMMTDQQRGEDLAQETFAKLFQKRASYKPTGKFSTYLWRVAMNTCYDELRKRKRQWEREFEQLDEEGQERSDRVGLHEETPLDTTAQSEEAAMVRDAVAKLPESYRSVLILRHYEGLKLREIAEVLEIPPGTVNSRMAEALSRLQRLLGPKLNKLQTSEDVTPPQELPKVVPLAPLQRFLTRTQTLLLIHPKLALAS